MPSAMKVHGLDRRREQIRGREEVPNMMRKRGTGSQSVSRHRWRGLEALL